jgi:hypothetical protein
MRWLSRASCQMGGERSDDRDKDLHGSDCHYRPGNRLHRDSYPGALVGDRLAADVPWRRSLCCAQRRVRTREMTMKFTYGIAVGFSLCIGAHMFVAYCVRWDAEINKPCERAGGKLISDICYKTIKPDAEKQP